MGYSWRDTRGDDHQHNLLPWHGNHNLSQAANLLYMGHKQQRLLEAISKGHVSANIHWREVESLLKFLGTEFHESHGARLRVVLNGIEETLHRPHHGATLTKQDVHSLRQFLTTAGIG